MKKSVIRRRSCRVFGLLAFRTLMPRKKLLATDLCGFVSKNPIAVDAENIRIGPKYRFSLLLIMAGIHREIHIVSPRFRDEGKSNRNAIRRRSSGRICRSQLLIFGWFSRQRIRTRHEQIHSAKAEVSMFMPRIPQEIKKESFLHVRTSWSFIHNP